MEVWEVAEEVGRTVGMESGSSKEEEEEEEEEDEEDEADLFFLEGGFIFFTLAY